MNTDRIFLVLVPLLRPWVKAGARRRRADFAAEAAAPGRVVFVGDSITQRGSWDELFPELATLNRGIDGDTTEDVLARLDAALDNPVAVSLMIGTNDLHTNHRLKAPEGIASRVESIVRRIRHAAPGADVFVNGLTPRTPYFAERIQHLNRRYREIAERAGATYVDLWPAMADDNGALRTQYTFDNLHLSPDGYRAWGEVLRPLLASHASSAPDPKSNKETNR